MPASSAISPQKRWITLSWGVFLVEVWETCLRRFLLHGLVVVQEMGVMLWWTTSRKRLPKEIRRGFDALFFVVGWLLWKERNARTFQRLASSPAQLLDIIEQEISLWCAAGYKHLVALDARRRSG